MSQSQWWTQDWPSQGCQPPRLSTWAPLSICSLGLPWRKTKMFITGDNSKATSGIACHSYYPRVRATEERENLLHVLERASIWILVTESTTEQYKPREYSLEGSWGSNNSSELFVKWTWFVHIYTQGEIFLQQIIGIWELEKPTSVNRMEFYMIENHIFTAHKALELKTTFRII